MNESQFINKIDCCFYCYNKKQTEKLARLGCAISANAGFMVAYEFCGGPGKRGRKVTQKERLKLLSVLYRHLKHPLKNEILQIAKTMILNDDEGILKYNEAKRLMKKCKAYKGQYNALLFARDSCDDNRSALNVLWDEIINLYSKRQN